LLSVLMSFAYVVPAVWARNLQPLRNGNRPAATNASAVMMR